MTQQNPDDRSPMSIGLQWSARLMSIGLEMALPAAGGGWLDSRVGTSPVFTALGALLGFAVGMYHLLRISRQESGK